MMMMEIMEGKGKVRGGGTYVQDVDIQRVQVRSGFVPNQLFFLRRADDDVHDEATAFEVERQRARDGFIGTPRYDDDFPPCAVAGPFRPSLLRVRPSFAIDQEHAGSNKCDKCCCQGLVFLNPVLSARDVALRYGANYSWRRWRRRLHGFGQPCC